MQSHREINRSLCSGARRYDAGHGATYAGVLAVNTAVRRTPHQVRRTKHELGALSTPSEMDGGRRGPVLRVGIGSVELGTPGECLASAARLIVSPRLLAPGR